MSVLRKLGGLVCIFTIATFSVGIQNINSAHACSFQTLDFETGDGFTLPNHSKGVYLSIYNTNLNEKDFVVVRADAKGRKSTVTARLQKTTTTRRYFLAFDRPAKSGETYRVTYSPWSRTYDLTIHDQLLKSAADLKLQVNVDTSGGASLVANAKDSIFRNLWQYRFAYQSESLNSSRSSNRFLNLCADDDGLRVGWRELSVEVTPGDSPALASIATIDVWVDCTLAKNTKHPSISKASNEHFVPNSSAVAIRN